MTQKELSLKLRMFNSVDRLIYINILLRNSLFNENEISGISIEDVIFDKSLIVYLSDCRMNLIHSILRETSFSSYKKKIKHLEPIFKDKYFEASPFIMDFDTWKEVISYNLSFLPKEKAKYEIIEYLERIVDLSYRLNSGSIPEFDTILFDYGSHSIHSGIEILSNSNYDFPLERYSAFLKSIDLSKISDNDTFDLIYRIKNLENRLSPEKVNHAPEYKIVLSKSASVNSLIKG